MASEDKLMNMVTLCYHCTSSGRDVHEIQRCMKYAATTTNKHSEASEASELAGAGLFLSSNNVGY
jgi:hypothetical protein